MVQIEYIFGEISSHLPPYQLKSIKNCHNFALRNRKNNLNISQKFVPTTNKDNNIRAQTFFVLK
jgi:hypothetical protein